MSGIDDRDGAPAQRYRRIVVLDGATLDPGDNPWHGIAALGPLEVHERTPGGLVVERALGADVVLTDKTTLGRGRPAFAALDVLKAEQPPPGRVLATQPRCIVTPHDAWASLAARGRIMVETAASLRAFAQGAPRNVAA